MSAAVSSENIGEMGVAKCKLTFNGYGWIFREQHVHDKGIDAQIEIIDNQHPTPKYKLIAVQIKSGDSYFNETKDGFVIHRPKKEHIEYWINYPIPVIMVLYHRSKDQLI